jgi:acetoacetyl-CoA synthetase
MMWNFLVSSLLLGVRPLLYDRHPGYPSPDVLWEMAQNAGVTMFGASPAHVDLLSQAGLVPGDTYDLSALKSVMVARLPPGLTQAVSPRTLRLA